MKFKPSFLIIPYQIIEDSNLQPLDRILYGVIYYFEKMKEGKCKASNKTLMEYCRAKTPISVANSLMNLERAGYIKRFFKDETKKNRKEIRCLVDFETSLNNDTKADDSSNDDTVSLNDESNDSSNDEQISNNIISKSRTSSKEEGSKLQTYGKPLINSLVEALKGFNQTTGLDGSKKWNRIGAKNVSEKIRREFISRSGKDPNDNYIISSFKMILTKADNFHKEKMTDFSYINKNFYKIIKSSQNNKGKKIII